jgi:predicted porin
MLHLRPPVPEALPRTAPEACAGTTFHSHIYGDNMKRTSMRQAAVAALLAGTAAAAVAQSSVTLYGIIDAGIQTRNRAATANDSLTEVRSGNLSPSIWGFKGQEDLGSGLKAFFNLEGHFASDTGAQTTGPGFGAQIFRRQANVGISGDWGTLTLGRQYSPAIIATMGVEPRAYKEQFSGLYVWAYNQLAAPGNAFGAGSNGGNDVGVFIGNALQYTHQLGPVWLGVGYSLGEVAGGGRKGSELSLGASYSGPVTIGLGYHDIRDTASGQDVNRAWTLGAAVPFGALTGKLAVIEALNNDPATGARVSKVRSVGAGVDYRWSERNVANLSVYRATYRGDAEVSNTSVVLANEWSLSKRTTLFAQLAYVRAGAYAGSDPLQSLKTTVVADGQLAGFKTSLLGAGIRHSF